MAGLGPFETWRVPEINTLPDAKKSLVELQRILENMQFQLEQGPGSTASDAESIQGNPVEAGTPATGDVYRWDGSQFALWSPKWMVASLSAAQTARLAAGNHVEFDDVLSTSGHITLSSGAGQADGIFTLPEGVWMVRVGNTRATFSGAAGTFTFSLRDGVGALIGTFGRVRPYSAAVDQGEAGNTEGILDNRGLGSVDVELRIEAGSGNLTAIDAPTLVSITALA